MKRKIFLHGALGEKYGDCHEFDVATAGEAVRALSVNFKGFAEDLKEGYWEVVRGDTETGLALDLEDVNDFNLGNADLHFIPVPAGSKRRGAIKAVLGVALVGAAMFLSGGTLAGVVGAGLATGMTGNLAMVGAALTLSGVSSLLAPKEQPKTTPTGDNTSHYMAPGNAYDQGNPVPLVYGQVHAGAVVISAGLRIDRILPEN